MARVTGLLLAAGSGRRFGRPKALVDTGSGPWVLHALATLGGCDDIMVVIGAQAAQVAALLPSSVQILTNLDHAAGMGLSLARGLAAIGDGPSDAALVMLVDLPDVSRAVADRFTERVRVGPSPAAMLARAAYQGRPGHPVLLGRDHFAGVVAGAAGDVGARDYLAAHQIELIECGDIGGGRDVDTPAQV